MTNRVVAAACFGVSVLFLSGCSPSGEASSEPLQFSTPRDFLETWIDHGGICEQVESVTFLDFNGGKLVQCNRQNAMPVWFADSGLASKFASNQLGQYCTYNSNWVVTGIDNEANLALMREGLGGDLCK